MCLPISARARPIVLAVATVAVSAGMVAAETHRATEASRFLDRAASLDRGGPDQREEAIVWYSRAAARGEARAQYFLGMLWETGDGVPRVPDHARAWYAAAAGALPAAAERLGAIGAAPATAEGAGGPAAASILFATVSESGRERLVELVWSSGPQPDGALFHVAVLPTGPDPAPLLEAVLPQTAFVAVLPRGAPPCCARLTVIDPKRARYAPAAWTTFGADAAAAMPPPVADIVVAFADGVGGELLADISADLAASGLRFTTAPAEPAAGTSAIVYHYVEDRPLAEALAGLLPGEVPVEAHPAAGVPPPGRVTIRLVSDAPD